MIRIRFLTSLHYFHKLRLIWRGVRILVPIKLVIFVLRIYNVSFAGICRIKTFSLIHAVDIVWIQFIAIQYRIISLD